MKVPLNKKTLLFVHPVFIIGSYNENMTPNICAVSWGGVCCSEPPCVAIALRKDRQTWHNIMHHRAFTFNIPGTDFIRQADYAGIYSGRDENKFDSLGLTAIHGELVQAPVVAEFPLTLICKLRHTVEIGSHTQFIGEVIESLADDSTLDDKGMPDIDLVKPFIYNSADRHYYSVGGKVMMAYSSLKNKEK